METHAKLVADPVILNVQVLPLWSAIGGTSLSAVEAKYGDTSSKLIHDPSVRDTDMPAYLLGGRQAVSAWKHLKGGYDHYPVLKYDLDKKMAC